MNNNGPLRIYRWVNADAVPQLVYEGDPSASDPIPAGRRFGDTIAVRGAGTATEILFSNRNTNTLSVLRTSNGGGFPTGCPHLCTRHGAGDDSRRTCLGNEQHVLRQR